MCDYIESNNKIGQRSICIVNALTSVATVQPFANFRQTGRSIKGENAERLPPLDANKPQKLVEAFCSSKLNGVLCLCCEQCVFNWGTKVSAAE